MSSEAIALWTETSSDPELIAGVRAGDTTAFGLLYERHVEAARKVATQYTNTAADVDDVVSESFSRVLRALQRGDGPDLAFRAYLFTIVRRAGMDMVNKGIRTKPREDMGEYEATLGYEASSDEPALEGFEHGMVAGAFKSLPERWQAVLWYTEVEKKSPKEIAPLLGLSANGVAALAYRAREALRQAYLQQHLNSADTLNCLEANTQLGAYVRGGLNKREHSRIDEHVNNCERCTALVLELQDVNRGMRGIIAPLVLGTLGMGALQGGMPIGGVFGAAGLAGGSSTGGTGAGAGASAGASGASSASAGASSFAAAFAGASSFVLPAAAVVGVAAIAMGGAGFLGLIDPLGTHSPTSANHQTADDAAATTAGEDDAVTLGRDDLTDAEDNSDAEVVTGGDTADSGASGLNGDGVGGGARSSTGAGTGTNAGANSGVNRAGNGTNAGFGTTNDGPATQPGSDGTPGTAGADNGEGSDPGESEPGTDNGGTSGTGGTDSDVSSGTDSGTGSVDGSGTDPDSDGSDNGDGSGADGGTGDGSGTDNDSDPGGSTDGTVNGDDPDSGDGAPPPPPPVGSADLKIAQAPLEYLKISRSSPTLAMSIANDGDGSAEALSASIDLPDGLAFASPSGGAGATLAGSAARLDRFMAFATDGTFASGDWICTLSADPKADSGATAEANNVAECTLGSLGAGEDAELDLMVNLDDASINDDAMTTFTASSGDLTVSYEVRTGIEDEDSALDTGYANSGGEDFVQVGAPLMGCDPAEAGCLQIMNFNGDTTQGKYNNNDQHMVALNDAPIYDSVETVKREIVSSSSGVTNLDLPDGAVVKKAILEWSANRSLEKWCNDNVKSDCIATEPPTGSSRTRAPADEWSAPLSENSTVDEVSNLALFRTPSADYNQITADSLTRQTLDNREYYVARADVTDLVTAGGEGDYALANISLSATTHDSDRTYYGGFALTVVYESADLAPSRVAIFDGAHWVSGNSDATIGFYTEGAASAHVGWVAWEGDRGTTGDTLSIDDENLRAERWRGLGDTAKVVRDICGSPASQPAVNVAPGTYTNAADATATGSRYANSLGVDAKSFETYCISNSGKHTLRVGTDGDNFLISTVAVRIQEDSPPEPASD